MLDNIQNSFEEFTSIKDYSEMLNNIIQIKKEKLIPSLLINQRRLLIRKKIFAKLLGDSAVEKNKTKELFVSEEIKDVVNNVRFPLFEFENIKYVYIKNNPKQLTKEEVQVVFEITKPLNVINKYHILNIKDLENLYDQYLEFIDMLSDDFITIQKESLKNELKKYDEEIIIKILKNNLAIKNINYKKIKDYKNIIWNKKINSKFEQNKFNWSKNILEEQKEKYEKIKNKVHELNEDSLNTLKNNLQDLISYTETFSKNEIELQQQIITNYFNGSFKQKGLLEKIDDLQKLSTSENVDKIIEEEIKLSLPLVLKEKGLTTLYSIVTEILSNNAFEHTLYLDEVIKNSKQKLEQKNYKYYLYEFINNLNFEKLPNKEELISKYKDKINLFLKDENILLFSEVIETISKKIQILHEEEIKNFFNEKKILFFENEIIKYEKVLKLFPEIMQTKNIITNENELVIYKNILETKYKNLKLINEIILKVNSDSKFIEHCDCKMRTIISLDDLIKIEECIENENENFKNILLEEKVENFKNYLKNKIKNSEIDFNLKIELLHNVFEKTSLNDLELLEIEIEKNLEQNNTTIDIEQSEDINNEKEETEVITKEKFINQTKELLKYETVIEEENIKFFNYVKDVHENKFDWKKNSLKTFKLIEKKLEEIDLEHYKNKYEKKLLFNFINSYITLCLEEQDNYFDDRNLFITDRKKYLNFLDELEKINVTISDWILYSVLLPLIQNSKIYGKEKQIQKWYSYDKERKLLFFIKYVAKREVIVD